MKKVILIFCVLSLLIFIRPLLAFDTNTGSLDNKTITTIEVDNTPQEDVSVFAGAIKA